MLLLMHLMGTMLLLRPARLTAHGTVTALDRTSVEEPMPVLRIAMAPRLVTADIAAITTTPSLFNALPVSTFNVPEKLLLPFKISVPQELFVNVAAPERLPLSVNVLPGLLMPTVHV